MNEYSGLLGQVKKLHFVGIGGSGMCPMAEILHHKGYALTGSDINESDTLQRIRGYGIPVAMGHKAENIGDAECVVYTAAWNWLVDNGYSVVSADRYAAGTGAWEDGWTFFVSKNGQSTFFNTELTVMQKVMVNGKAEYLEMGTKIGSNTTDDYKVTGDYMWADTGGTFNHTGARATTSTITLAWGTHGNNLMVVDGLYKVKVTSNAGSSFTDYYYKVGDSMDDELSGSWYAVGAAPTTSTGTSTEDVVMTAALDGKTIYDNYYRVQSPVSVVGGSTPVDEYVISGDDSSAVVASSAYSLYAKDADGTYVMVNASGEIENVDRDYSIVDSGYALVNQIVTVTDTSVSTQLNGMTIQAAVAPNTYVQVGDDITVTLSLIANGKVSAGKVDISAVTVNGQTATISGTPLEILDNTSNTLSETTITVQGPASFGTVTGGIVDVAFTLAVGA